MLNKKLKKGIFIFALVALVFFVLPANIFGIEGVGANVAKATVGETIAQFLSWVVLIITNAIGQILSVIFLLVNKAFSFQEFDIKGVSMGWRIVRDVCNMCFILVLLIIAFATILRLENYSMKKYLPKLLIMAVLINFSKTICFLLIDVSQVVMLTFASAFTGSESNFVTMLNIDKFYAISDRGDNLINTWQLFSALSLSLLFMVIAFFIMVMLLGILIMRMIMFWVLIVLSPLAFLSTAVPGGGKYWTQWWGEFTKYLLVGPVLAFFTWLSLTVVKDGSGLLNDLTVGEIKTMKQEDLAAAISKIGEWENVYTFILAIGLLIGTMKITQSLGAMGASFGANLASKAKMTGLNIGKKAVLAPLKGAKELGGFGVDKLSQGMGVDLNVARGWGRLKNKFAENKSSRVQNIEGKVIEKAKAGGRLATLSHGALAWDNLRSWKGAKRFVLGKRVGKIKNRIDDVKNERKNVLSDKEEIDLIKQKKEKEKRYQDLPTEIKKQEFAVRQAHTLNPQKVKEEEAKLDTLKQERKDAKTTIDDINKTFTTKATDNKKAKDLDDKLEKLSERDKYYELAGSTTATADSNAKIEGNQNKKISQIDNADELGRILKEAIEEGNQGLIAATSKKMTKMGDYNEMMSQLKLGTGTEGMHKLARIFERDGKMTRQNSLGLIGEIGGIAKNMNHFGAYGASRMEDGVWKEATSDQAQTAQLAEMMKMQPQAFSRSVNRLGLGHYKDGEQTADNWEMGKAAIAYIKLNEKPLAENYKKTGQQNALEHLSSSINQLTKNGIKVDSDLVVNIKQRATGKGTDVEQVIKNTK